MNTPQKVTPGELYHLVAEWRREHTRLAHGQLYCLTCNAAIQSITAYMSLHEIFFGDSCAGNGRVHRMLVPFCPNCEPVPQLHGCIHITYAPQIFGEYRPQVVRPPWWKRIFGWV